MFRLIAAGLVAVGSAGAALAQDTMTPPAPPPTTDTTAPAAGPATAPTDTTAQPPAPADATPPPPPAPTDAAAPPPPPADTVPTPPPPPPTTMAGATDWTGLYAGIHGGYGFDNDRAVTDTGTTANNIFAITNNIRPSTLKVSREGILGGGQIGYLRQFNNIIVGVEGDFSYMDNGGIKDYRSPATVATFPIGRRLRVSNDLDWMTTARIRAGYALGTGMIYATGGYAAGRIRGRATFYGDNDNQINYTGSHRYTASGWTAGGGFEFKPFGYSPGILSKFSVRGELLYYDLGKSHIYALQTGAQPGYYVLGVDYRGFNGRVGLNYHF